jgi:ankyrin repeat protein
VIRALIRGGSDISRTDNIDDTALHVASYWGNNEAVEELLGEGASPYLENSFGHTPLSLAVSSNRTKAANLLREAVGEPTVEYKSTNPFSEWDGDISNLDRVDAKPPWEAEDLYSVAGGKEQLEKKVNLAGKSPRRRRVLPSVLVPQPVSSGEGMTPHVFHLPSLF